jgi:hypothetical protein
LVIPKISPACIETTLSWILQAVMPIRRGGSRISRFSLWRGDSQAIDPGFLKDCRQFLLVEGVDGIRWVCMA